MPDLDFIGRYSMPFKAVLISVLMLASVDVLAADASVEVELVVNEAESSFDVAKVGSKARRMDTAVFTEITPVVAPDVAIKLPDDQQDKSE